MSRPGRDLWERSERGQLVVKPSQDRTEELAYEQAVQETPPTPGGDAIEWAEKVQARALELIAERSQPKEWYGRDE